MIKSTVRFKQNLRTFFLKRCGGFVDINNISSVKRSWVSAETAS